MKLRELLNGLADCPAALGEIEVAGVSADSRELKAGDVFFALSGAKADGAKFAEQALAKGAIAVISDHLPASGNIIRVSNARHVLAMSAARLFPHQPSTIVAVTGTSGKTSVAAFTQQIWAHSGHLAASLGTIGVVAPSRTSYGSLTTPPIRSVCIAPSMNSRPRTRSRISWSKHPRTGCISIVSMACASAPVLSPICRATTWIIIRRSRNILLRKCACSRDLVQPGGAAVVAADHDEADRVIAASKARGLRILTVGRKGGTIKLRNVGIEGFSQRIDISYEGNDQTLMLPLVAPFRSRMLWFQPRSLLRLAATPRAFLPRLKIFTARPAGWSASANAMAHRSSSTMPTSPTRWPRRWKR